MLQVYGFVLSCMLYRDGNTAIAAMETMNSTLLSSSPSFCHWLTSTLPDAAIATQFWLDHTQGRSSRKGQGGEGGGGEGVEGGEEGEDGEGEEGGEEGEGGEQAERGEERGKDIFLGEGHNLISEASSLGEVTVSYVANTCNELCICCRESMMITLTMTRSHIPWQPLQSVKCSFL